jgi:hypothetical protein
VVCCPARGCLARLDSIHLARLDGPSDSRAVQPMNTNSKVVLGGIFVIPIYLIFSPIGFMIHGLCLAAAFSNCSRRFANRFDRDARVDAALLIGIFTLLTTLVWLSIGVGNVGGADYLDTCKWLVAKSSCNTVVTYLSNVFEVDAGRIYGRMCYLINVFPARVARINQSEEM